MVYDYNHTFCWNPRRRAGDARRISMNFVQAAAVARLDANAGATSVMKRAISSLT